ncbi:AGE family epimerase/isomerase [Terriglobus sp. TAA 43]|uniref:AGE family epimerase/isomerase n=1 Tax=Terriglobus sp. TAA 43 TaxID=278961 RepID=UPI0009FFC074|nr:AGE family epimerase/isomerase [Terriglobus sp. TAA 43]
MMNRRHFGRLGLGTLALLSVEGWGEQGQSRGNSGAASSAAKNIDRAWVKKAMLPDLLDHWLTASVMPNGFIQENLDREWKPFGTQREASLNGQGRQLYCMVAGYEHSKDRRYLDAVTKCADFLIKMRDPQYGGYFNRTTPDLKVIDDTKTGYTSFTIFPLAHAARVTGKKEYADAALQSWHEVSTKMRDGQFFYNSMKRDFSGTAPMTIGNPSGAVRPAGQGPAPGAMMRRHGLNVHMFEALLALYETTKSKEVWSEIQTEMAAFEKMYDYSRGYLPEGYDDHWKAPDPKTYNVGHLFEWGSLFSRAVELGADKKFIELGSRSVDLGLKMGFHKPTGGTWMIANADGSGPARDYMIWWTQCETIKATARYATLHGRSDLWSIHHQALDFVKKNFLDHEYGGWFEGVIPGKPREALGDRAYLKGAVDGPELGSYHQTTMFTDLLHLSA